MENPVLAEVTRGNVVESRHRGAAIVVDADGGVVFSAGDVARPVFPRSAVKAIQGLPLIESGAADRYGLTAADAQRMRDLQAEISTWKREGKAVGRLGLGISGCALGDGPAPDARGSVLIRLAPAEAFLPLISDGRLADLLGPNALAAIEPCKAAQ